MFDFKDDSDCHQININSNLDQSLADDDSESHLEMYLNETYLDSMFVNKEPLSSSDMVELYVSKSQRKEPKEEVIIDDGVLELEYTPYELMFSYLMRLNLRFRPVEIEYLQAQTNVPVCLFDKDGGDRQRWLSISQCQKLIKAWRKTRTESSPIMTDEELLKLEDLSEQSLQGYVNIVDNDYSSFIYFSQENTSELPCITGCLMDSKGNMLAQPFTIDTAASSSILPYDKFKQLGYKDSELDTSENIVIATACSKGNSASGTFTTKIFLRGNNGKFYFCVIRFLVMKSKMNRVLIGISDLRFCKAKWDSSGKTERLTLTVKNVVNKSMRKSFDCFNPTAGGNLLLHKPGESVHCSPSKIKFHSKNFVDTENIQFSCKTSFVIHKVNYCEPQVSVKKVNVGGHKIWPTGVDYLYNVELSSDKTRPVCQEVHFSESKKKKLDQEEEISILTEAFSRHLEILASEKMDEPSNDLEDMDQLPDVPDLNKFVLDMAGVGPPDPEVKDQEFWYLPNMDGLSDYWKEKFSHLFYVYRENFAKSKYDFNQSKLPPITIELKDDYVPAYDKPRRYGSLELLLIDDYIDNLVKAGHVRELTETSSPFNHCLVLVYRQDPNNKVFVSSKADRADMTNAERLDLLKKNSRLCADMRSLNRQCKSVGAMYLSRFQEVLPSFSNRVLSSLDIKSGYSICTLDYQSSLYTAFVHRNKQYIWLSLPQGLVQAPPLFVRRLSIALNDQSYNEFSQEKNKQLENKEDHPLLIYDCDPSGQHECQEMTELKTNNPESRFCEIFEDNQELFMENYVHVAVLCEGFSSNVEPYMDDIMEVTRNFLEHFYVWWYIMEQFDHYHIKIAASKVQLMGTDISYLGYNISVLKNEYGLTVKRKQDFSQWKLPTSRSILLSRMCIANYFGNVILSLKVITQCLSCLVNSKRGVFHVKEIHKREFEMLKLAIDLCSSFHIPDLRYPSIYSSDSSFSALAGSMMQYLPDPKAEGGFTLYLVSQFSKKFSTAETSKCPLYKEILGCLATLREYEHYIRNSVSFNILFSDASSLSMVSKLSHINSRLHSFAVYLSSFPNLWVFFSPSSRANFLCDWITKIYCGMNIKMDEAVPQKYLEVIDNIKLKKGQLIDPQTMRNVLQSPLPSFFSDIPERRKQAFDPLFDYNDFVNLINQPTVEEQYLKGLLFGYDSIKPDSVAFQRRDKQGLVSRDEFNKMYQKSKGDSLKEHFKGLIEHSVHVCDFTDISDRCREWAALLDKYMRTNSIKSEASLSSACSHYLQCINPTLDLFRNLVNHYQNSSLYNTLSDTDEIFPTLFVSIYVHPQSKCKIRNNLGNLSLSCKHLVTIEPYQAFVLKVNITYVSRYVISVSSQFSDVLVFHPQIRTFQSESFIEDILMFNNSDSTLKINANSEIFLVKCHRQISNQCQCEKQQQIKYVVDYGSKGTEKAFCEILFSSEFQGGISNDTDTVTDHEKTGKFLGDTMTSCQGKIKSSPTSKYLDSLIEEEDFFPCQRPGHKSSVAPLETNNPWEILLSDEEICETPKVNVSPEDHNSILLAGLLLQKTECFTPALVKQLQNTCPYLVDIREKLKNSSVKNFMLTKGILYHSNKWNINVLCLDRVTMGFIVQSVHASHRHYSDQMMNIYISSYFFCVDLKAVILAQKKQCAVCIFNVRCSKIKFINNPSETEPVQPFTRLYSDVDEFWPRNPKSQKSYLCLFVCSVSHYVIAYSLKTQTAKELCAVFNDVVKNFGVCREFTSDFGAMYRSQSFRDLLLFYNISHRKYSPSRSPESGKAEIAIKEYRRTYMNLLISLVGSDTKEWDKYLPQASLIFNSQAIHGSVNNISRFNLFFNANRFTPNYLYSKMSEDLGLEAAMRQQVAFKNIFEKRQQFRQYYDTLENPYSIGQYVCRPLSKDEFQTRDNSKGAQATVQNIYKVLKKFPNSCLVASLMDSGESVQDLKHLRPLEPCEVKNLFGKVLTDRGSFSKSLFKRGNRDEQIFQKLDKLSLFSPRCPGTDNSLYDPGIFDQDLTDADHAEENIDNVDNHSDDVVEVLDVPDAEQLLTPENEHLHNDNESQLIPPELEGTVSSTNPSHPYHLRPRPHRKTSNIDTTSDQEHQPLTPEPDHEEAEEQHEDEPEVRQRLRPRKVKKYTFLNEKERKVTFCDSVKVSEFCKVSPTMSALRNPELYPCKHPRRDINIDDYFPGNVPHDPDLSRDEIALLLISKETINS